MTDHETPKGLKPCPFCGGSAFLQKIKTAPNDDSEAWKISCSSCGATPKGANVFNSIVIKKPNSDIAYKTDGKTAAINAWERRANNDKIRTFEKNEH